MLSGRLKERLAPHGSASLEVWLDIIEDLAEQMVRCKYLAMGTLGNFECPYEVKATDEMGYDRYNKKIGFDSKAKKADFSLTVHGVFGPITFPSSTGMANLAYLWQGQKKPKLAIWGLTSKHQWLRAEFDCVGIGATLELPSYSGKYLELQELLGFQRTNSFIVRPHEILTKLQGQVEEWRTKTAKQSEEAQRLKAECAELCGFADSLHTYVG